MLCTHALLCELQSVTTLARRKMGLKNSGAMLFVTLFMCSFHQFVYSNSLEPLVTIPSLGQVRGSLMSSFNQREFLAFRGIPYAQPPVGDLRFKVKHTFCYPK